MQKFNQLVTPIGAMLRNTGLSADAAAKSSINLAKRAADMASVFNVDVSEALGAIQAGLRGELDPLEKFGVSMNEAKIKAKALELGLGGVGGELSANDKAQARLALVMSQTTRVAGDFINTSGELANKQRINAAAAENTTAKLGQGLLPVMKTYQGLLGTVTGFMGEHTTVTKVGVGVLALLAVTLGAVSVAVKVKTASIIIASAATKAWTAAQWLLNAALHANPIGIVIAALVALGVGLVIAYQKSETFRDIVKGALNIVAAAGDKVADVFRWFRDHAGTILSVLSKASGLADPEDGCRPRRGLVREFMSALLAAHKSRGVEGADGRLDPGIVDEVVLERYGGWTDEATRMVNRVEERTPTGRLGTRSA